MTNIIKIIIVVLLFTSCKKDWLDAKPKQSLSTIGSIEDVEKLMENTGFNTNLSFLGELGCDDYYIASDNFNSVSLLEQNAYSWASTDNFYGGQNLIYDWDYQYSYLFAINTALERLEKITPSATNIAQWNNIKGRALFFRAFVHYYLAQLFCKTYNEATADADPGIILRVEADVNIPSKRASVRATYESIVGDLSEAIALLSDLPAYKSQPSKHAATALLARIYLIMGEYVKALENADLCLAINDELLDYNTVDANSDTPFPMYSKEVIFWTDMAFSSLIPSQYGIAHVDSVLYSMYDIGDLRRKVFFGEVNGAVFFKGSHASYSFIQFAGLAVDEVYLIKAECLARNDNTTGSLEVLNVLLQNRWDNSVPYIPYETTDNDELILKILDERRKELCFRGLRWTDLRRLNIEDKYKRTIQRGFLGSSTMFTLPPNDNRYVYPFPENEIKYSKVEQNPR